MNFTSVSPSDGLYSNHTPDDSLQAAQLVMYINILAIPSLFIIGVCGNGISLIVFMCTHLRYKSSSIYLACLNIADTGFLVSLIPAWLGWVHIDIFHTEGWCQTTIYAAYVFAFLSVWIVVGFTVERFVVVFHPLKRTVICTTRRALVAIGLLTLFALVFYSYTLWTTGVHMYQSWPTCMSKEYYIHALEVLSTVDTLITLVLPSIAIIVLNGSIALKLVLYYRQHSRLNTESDTAESWGGSDPQAPQRNNQDDATPCDRLNPAPTASPPPEAPEATTTTRKTRTIFSVTDVHTQLHRQRNFQNRTTRTLMMISTIFILLNFPSHAFRIYAVALALAGRSTNMSYSTTIVQELCLLMYYANFASNLFLYTLCSKCFRLALIKLYYRIKRKVIAGFTVSVTCRLCPVKPTTSSDYGHQRSHHRRRHHNRNV